MRLRLAVLLMLVALAVGVRSTSIYLRYLSSELSSQLPLGTAAVNGGLYVSKVDRSADCYRGWSAASGSPEVGDRVVAVYDHQGHGGLVHGMFDYGLFVRPINIEEPWTLVVERHEGASARQLALQMPPSVPIDWTAAEWLVNLGADFYLPLLAVMTALLIGVLRWRDDQAWLASALFLALGLAAVPSLSQFPPGWRVVALVLQVSAAHLLPYLVFRFFLRFPARSPVDRAVPWLNPLFAGATALCWLAAVAYAIAVHVSLPAAGAMEAALARAAFSLDGVKAILTGCAGLMLFTALVSIVLNARQAKSRAERSRLRIIAAGAVTGLLPALWLYAAATAEAHVPVGLLVIVIPLIGVFPLSFAYAVVRHRVFGIRLILRRGLTYALVSRGFLVAEAVLIFVVLFGAGAALFEVVEPQPSLAATTGGTALVTFMLTLGMRRVNRRVLPVIDRRFFRDAYDGRRILNDLGRAVRQMASQPDKLISHVAREIVAALHPRTLAIFVAPDAGSRLVPVDLPPLGCCDLSIGQGERQRFVLCFEERGGAGEAPPAAGSRQFLARSPLGPHLAACVAAEPDALEIEAFDSPSPDGGRPWRPLLRAPSRWGGEVDAWEEPCTSEEELYARFQARLVVPLVTAGRVLGFLVLGEKRSEEPYTREDRELLLTVAAQVAIALDYAQLIGQAAEQAALRREVQIAQEVQRQLFPHERPPMRSLRYTGLCRAARGVGGDFYDFLPLAAGRLGIALADIAGKGLPAALLMANLQALIRSHAPTYEGALERLASELNRHLVESTDGARFATLFFAVYDEEARSLRYVNAGHLPPFVVRRSDDNEPVHRLEAGGMVLGLFPDQAYDKGCAPLQRGDRLVVFSDGVTEAANPSGEMFGEARLLSSLLAHSDADVEQLPGALLHEVESFVGRSPQQDDITIIAAEVV